MLVMFLLEGMDWLMAWFGWGKSSWRGFYFLELTNYVNTSNYSLVGLVNSCT